MRSYTQIRLDRALANNPRHATTAVRAYTALERNRENLLVLVQYEKRLEAHQKAQKILSELPGIKRSIPPSIAKQMHDVFNIDAFERYCRAVLQHYAPPADHAGNSSS